MTAKEFANNNSDVILERLSFTEFQALTDGCVIFCITVVRGSRPSADRKVINAGYHLVANTRVKDGLTTEISTLCTTKYGSVKVDYINYFDASDEGTKILYKCNPLPNGDVRSGGLWKYD